MNKTLYYALFLLFGVFISSVSQVVLKKAANEKHTSIIQEYLNPKVIGAYAVFVLATLLNVYSYKGIPLSMGPVLESTSYIYVTYFGYRFFDEKITAKKIVSLVLIVLGIVVYSLSA